VRPVLEWEEVVVRADGRTILEGVSLSVEEGEYLAVIGPNGAGKSTLLKAALGLVPLAAGAVRLFGEALGRFRSWERVGYAPQRFGPPGGGFPLSVQEMVAMGLVRSWFPSRLSPRGRARVAEALELLGLGHIAATPVHRLSGGELQRVLVARALVSGADLLLLDEPAAGVDAETREVMFGAFQEMHQQGKTLVVVCHGLQGLLGRGLQRVAAIDGTLLWCGPPTEVPAHLPAPEEGVCHHGEPPRVPRRSLAGPWA
jgi:zinc transport system ATP-binding protein